MAFFDFFKKRAPSVAAHHTAPEAPAAPEFTERIVTREELAHLSDEVSVALEQSGADGKRSYMIGKPSVLRDVLGDGPSQMRPRRRKQAQKARSHDFMGVAGESYRQSALSSLISLDGPLVATLIPEPTNPHDKNAIRVVVNGQHVGYLKREAARQFGQAIAAADTPVQCRATLHPPKPPNANIAVTLDFTPVYALVETEDEDYDGWDEGDSDEDDDERD